MKSRFFGSTLRSKELSVIHRATHLGRRTWVALLVFHLVLVPLSLIDIFAVKVIFDWVLLPRRIDRILPLIGAMAGAMMLGLLAQVLLQLKAVRLAQFWDALFKGRMLRSVLHKPLEFFRQLSSGEVVYRILNDLGNLPLYLTQARWSFWVNIFMTVTIVGVMFYLDVGLGLLMMAAIPLQMLLLFWIARRCRELAGLLKRHDERLLGELENMLSGVEPLQALVMEDHVRRDWFSGFRCRQHIEKRMYIYVQIVAPIVMRMGMLMALLVLGVGSYRVMIGVTSIGSLMAFMMVAGRLHGPIQFLASYHVSLQDTIMCCHRAKATWESAERHLKPEYCFLSKISKPVCRSRPVHPSELVLDEVTYGYPNKRTVLAGTNWRIGRGDLVKLDGGNGAGKSTALRVLSGLLVPHQGRARCDNVSLAELGNRSRRECVIYLSEDSYWFKGSIRENLLHMCHQNCKDLHNCLDISDAATIVSHLPRGLDTELASRGANLSRGERQKLAIARALLAKPAFLLLDEALTSIHKRNAENILRKSYDYLQDKCGIVYVHHGSDFELDNQQVFEMCDGLIRGINRETK